MYGSSRAHSGHVQDPGKCVLTDVKGMLGIPCISQGPKAGKWFL